MRAEEIGQLALATARKEGASDAVVAISDVQETMVRFSNNQITTTNSLADISTFIFVMDGARRAGINVSEVDRRSIERATKDIVAEVKTSPMGEVYAPIPEGPFKYSPELIDQAQVPLTGKQLVDWVEEGVNAALEEGAKRVAGSLIARNTKYTLQTSGGAFGSITKPSLELSLRAFHSDLASGHGVSVSGNVKAFDPSSAGRQAGRLAKLAKDPVNCDADEYEAVLGPLVFADLVSQLGTMASAFYVDAGMSFLTDGIGRQVCSDKLDLYDDPTLPGTYGSLPFDMEGLPTKRKAIVEKGVLMTYLHNSTTAKRHGVDSTANAGLISPSAFNLVIGEGDGKLEEMIAGVEKGIYVTNDWYLRYQNWRTGDFSAIPRDAMFLIEDGELSHSIKEMRISDNVLRILAGIKQLTREREWVKWWEVDTPTLTPSALISRIRFTRSTM